MAVKNVSNMAGFISALVGAVSGDTIEILADLNFDDVVNTFGSTVQLGGGDVTNNITINGNNHAIYNLSAGLMTASTITLFSFGTGTNNIINNLSFLNCNCGSSNIRIISSSGNGNLIIHNAVIQGRFKSCMFQGKVTVRDSMITIDHASGRGLSTGSANTTPEWLRCWINCIECQYSYGSSGAWGYNIHSCYIQGKITASSAPDNFTLFSGVNDSCINVQTYIPTPTPNTVISASPSGSLQSANIINISKITSATPMTEESSTTWVKCVTDEHMKDAEYLANIGFNIIP